MTGETVDPKVDDNLHVFDAKQAKAREARVEWYAAKILAGEFRDR